MLIRYYITSIIIATIMIAVGQPLWALIPGILMIIMATGSIQAKQTNIESLQQFATDNVMLLSWVALMVGASRLMCLGGHELLTSIMWISLITIGAYCCALAIKYQDGIIVRHQASIISVVATMVCIIVLMIQYPGQIQQFGGVGAIYLAIVGAILGLYRMVAHIFARPLPSLLCDEVILLWSVLIPIAVIITAGYSDIIRACLAIIVMYLVYGRGLQYLTHYHYPTTDNKEVTLDLILKGYKTSHISHITRRSRVNEIFSHLSQVHPIVTSIIQRIPDIIMRGAYIYLTTHLLQGGIMMSDFIAYCLVLVGYIALRYVYQSNPSLQIDTTAQSFVVGYMSILALMITVFSSDPVTGSVVGILWVVINALIVAQYDRLDLGQYVQLHHAKRRVWANTASAIVIIAVLVQLPIDTVMMIPIILIVMAILGFTIAQSYGTLRTLTK